MAAFAATMLGAVSCQKDGGIGTQEGEEAKMGITISFPKSSMTRASDTNASDQDLIVSSIDVFVFNPDGTADKGNDKVEIGHFTEDANAGKWTLNDANLIPTTAGKKRIYVGINLPDGLKNAASEAVLTGEINNVDGLFSNTDQSKGPAMLSKATEKEIVATTQNQINTVSVSVIRMSAKVTATMGQSFTSTPTAVTEPKFRVTPDRFTVGNTAMSYYPVQIVNGSTLVTPGDMNALKPVALLDRVNNELVAVNPYNTAGKNKTGRYVPEHAVSNLTREGESTYAVVRGKLEPTHMATVSGSDIDESTPAPADFTNPVWVISYSGKVYFTATTTDRDNVIAALHLQDNASNYYKEYTPAGDNKLYCFYHVFLAKNEADPLAIYRNTIYDVIINSVKGLGMPGLLDAPEQPDEPVYEQDARLDVEVAIEDWNYRSANTDLE
jgi:hypothetical protein